MTISGGSSLPKDDIERMMREAEEHAEEDRLRREEVDVRNAAESAVYGTEKFLAENGDKLPETNRTEVSDVLQELKSALGGSDVAAIKSASERLAQVSQAAGAAIYAQAQQSADAGGTGSGGAQDANGGSADEDVVDAEIVDEDEQK